MNQIGTTTTLRGRVVYNRKHHSFGEADAARVLRKVGGLPNPLLDLRHLRWLFTFLIRHGFLNPYKIKAEQIRDVPSWQGLRDAVDKIAGYIIPSELVDLADWISDELNNVGTIWIFEIPSEYAYAWTAASTAVGDLHLIWPI